MRHVFALSALVVAAGVSAVRADDLRQQQLYKLAEQAVSADEAAAARATGELRGAGTDGLQALFTVHRKLIDDGHRLKASRAATEEAVAWRRLAAALDMVAGQRDCYTSRLFWHTDLAAARRAAQQQGKPILSLRLLGNLTDELSCANSRFFRSTLYANHEVGNLLREHFVLHWESVRPVPRVTIDFGDGRKIETTVTGNSIHYVLDCQGRVLDALPGLYGPNAFRRELERGRQLAKDVSGLADADGQRELRSYHRQRTAEIQAAWRADLRQVGIEPVSTRQTRREPSEPPSPHAWTPEAAVTTDTVWMRLGALHAGDAQLDQASAALIAAQRMNVQNAVLAGRLAVSKAVVENPLLRMLASFQASLAVDTVRNEYLLHGQIHCWLAEANPVSLDALNDRVYAGLFATPKSDPWLGLLPANSYTGLENAGIVETAGQ